MADAFQSSFSKAARGCVALVCGNAFKAMIINSHNANEFHNKITNLEGKGIVFIENCILKNAVISADEIEIKMATFEGCDLRSFKTIVLSFSSLESSNIFSEHGVILEHCKVQCYREIPHYFSPLYDNLKSEIKGRYIESNFCYVKQTVLSIIKESYYLPIGESMKIEHSTLHDCHFENACRPITLRHTALNCSITSDLPIKLTQWSQEIADDRIKIVSQ